jgi:hypothetical protein
MAIVALALAGGLIWVKTPADVLERPSATNAAEECNSCTARHQNLLRLRDARNSYEKRKQ